MGFVRPTIDKGLPIPAVKSGWKTGQSKMPQWRYPLRLMEIGDSFLLPRWVSQKAQRGGSLPFGGQQAAFGAGAPRLTGFANCET